MCQGFQLNNFIILILKFFTITSLLLGNLLVSCQFSSLGQMKNYGAGPNGGGGNNGGSTGTTNGGNSVVSGSSSGSSTGVGSGEILGPRSLSLTGQEPTCEELRAMWRFSKRQSRAAEITNEIPTYRDPFTYNVWDPYYPTTRSLGGGGGMRSMQRYRDPNRPIFGRVITREPIIPARFPGRNRNGGEAGVRYYGAEAKTVEDPQRRRGQVRFAGGSSSPNNGQNSLTTHHGKFQELKELVWTERAKELAQQRKAEEMAARAAVLKEIANGQSYLNRRPLPHYSASPLMDGNRSPDAEKHVDAVGRFMASTQTGGQRPIYSGIPTPTGNRNGGVLLPSMVLPPNRGIPGGIITNADLLPGNDMNGMAQPKNLPLRPSHFRERNRSLFRQSATPQEFYLRETRTPGFSAYRNWEKNPATLNTNHDTEDIDNDDGYINHSNTFDARTMDDEAADSQQQQRQLDLQQLQELAKLLQQQKNQISEDFLYNIFYN